VPNVLRGHGLLPAPRRSHRSWRQFVRQHADQILAVDFFTVETVWAFDAAELALALHHG
jgi:hypothetical protein